MVKSAINFLFENSIFLIVGAIVALVWANTDNETYKALLHLPLFENGFFYDHNYFNEQVSAGVDAPKKVFTLHYLVNDVFAALLRNRRQGSLRSHTPGRSTSVTSGPPRHH